MRNWLEKNILLFFVASLTLGLAPFFSEPHLWGKIKWLLGGGVGMKPMDYFDFLMHLTPWLFLLVSAGLRWFTFRSEQSQKTG